MKLKKFLADIGVIRFLEIIIILLMIVMCIPVTLASVESGVIGFTVTAMVALVLSMVVKVFFAKTFKRKIFEKILPDT